MFTIVAVAWLLVGQANANQAPDQSPKGISGTEQVIDLRGIWRGEKLDGKKARARGLDPDVIVTPRKTVNVPPSFPVVAQLARQTGVVRLECRIETDGTVGSCVVRRKVSALLDAEALATVTRWRYQPLRVNGQPKPALVELTVMFSLG
jgi:TonB family protein